MRIVINAPAERMGEYLEEVARQFEDDFTSGHVDAETHWEIEDDAANDPEALSAIFGRLGR